MMEMVIANTKNSNEQLGKETTTYALNWLF